MHKTLFLIFTLVPFHLCYSSVPKEKMQLIQPLISTRAFQVCYCNKFEEKFLKELSHGNERRLLNIYRITFLLQKNPQLFKEKIVAHITSTLYASFRKQNYHLEQNLYLISLWKSLNPSSNEVHYLLDSLNKINAELWAFKRQYQNAQDLTFYIQELSHDFTVNYQKELSSMLASSLYYLLESNDVDSLLKIYPVAKKFQVHLPHLDQEVRNHLADAESLLQRGDYYRAKKWAEWVLMISPHEKRAEILLQKIALKDGF